MHSTPVPAGSQDIGPYDVLEDLGPAPFGMAYLALDTRSDRTAILKVIPPSRPGLCQEITPWEILLEETAALTRIYHRGLPALFDMRADRLVHPGIIAQRRQLLAQPRQRRQRLGGITLFP